MAVDTAVVQNCLANIGQQSQLMKDCLSKGSLLPALKHCSNFLNELRTSQLTPKQYYELYIAVYDALESLSAYLLQSFKSKQAKNGNSTFLTDLYELVQYSGNIIPRLYMMIAVGSACMSTKDTAAKEIMKDMIEMCRGVQHPIRGLFLRNYLSQKTKDFFPLATEEDLDETVDFLVTNFIEMNKLWVRLQHQGHSSERELRYQERKELKILVGSNLVRLSQVIDNFQSKNGYSSEEFYKEHIFPTITEQIIECRDHLAQSYLIDVVIQIFPDEFHFRTLTSLLNDVFLKLHPLLKKSELVATLVDRFVANHKYEEDLTPTTNSVAQLTVDEKEQEVSKGKNSVSTSSDVPVAEIFQSFWDFYLNLQTAEPDLPPSEFISILQSLVKLSLTYDPENFQNLDKIYLLANEKLAEHKTQKPDDDNSIQSLWLDLLITPVRFFSSLKSLIQLPFFHELFTKISNVNMQKQLALEIVDNLLQGAAENGEDMKEVYQSTEDIDDIFKYILVLIQETDGTLSTAKDLGITASIRVGNDDKYVSEQFLQTQEKICKMLHLIETPDCFKNLSMLFHVRKKYLNKNRANIIYLYPTLITKMTNKLRIAGFKQLKAGRGDSRDQTDLHITSNFKNISVVIEELYQYHHEAHSELILKLYLNLATVADQLRQENIAYELFSQCFVIYEESLVLNTLQNQIHNPHESMAGSVSYQAVLMIANRLASLRYFNKENYESLITKVTLYGSKLLKKQDQCRSICYCAHLWWWCDLWIEGPSPTVGAGEKEASQEEAEDAKGEGVQDDVEKQDEHNTPPNAGVGDGGAVSSQEQPALYRDAKRVLECLQKALRVADSCMDPYLLLKLFVEILNRSLVFNVYGNGLIDLRYINGLVDLIRTNIANFRDDSTRDEDDQEARLLRHIEEYFQRTLAYIQLQQVSEDRFPNVIV